MRYTGTLVRDLQSLAEVCVQWNARICANCGQCYGVHLAPDGICPVVAAAAGIYLQTSFRELDHEKKVAGVAAGNSASFCRSGDGKNK